MTRKTLLKSSNTRKYCLGCALFTGVLMFVFGILIVVYMESLINAYINKSLTFSEDSPTFKSWRDPPVAIKTKLYFFNLTNPVEFANGSKPRLVEVGPFVLGEQWQRRNVVFHNNGTMSSQLHKTLMFLPTESVASEFTNITTINVPLASALARARWETQQQRRQMNALFSVLKETLVISRSVHDLTFGYQNSLVDIARKSLPPGQSLPYDRFGFFAGKNNSLASPLLIDTGAANWRDIGRVLRYAGSRTLPFWNSHRCNMVNGSDGAMFPPGATEHRPIYLFARDLCRSVQLDFERHVEHSHVRTMRFTPPTDIFASPDTRPDNLCYCVDGPPCAPSGLFNISKCQYGSPTFMSFPHFYLADPSLLDNVHGLKPDKQKHQFFIDIAPRVGVAMKAKIRMQINFHIAPVADINVSERLRAVFLPVLWMEAGVDRLPDATISLVQQAMSAPAVARSSMTAVAFVSAVCLLLLAAVLLVRQRRSLSSTAAKNGPAPSASVAASAVTSPDDVSGGGGGGKNVEMLDCKPAYVPYNDHSTPI